MKKVMVTGTFDMPHKGHEFFLKEAKKHGDFLVVLIARDRTVRQVKGKKPLCTERQRKKMVAQLGIADKVILGSLGDKYAAIEKEKPRVICLGYDQKAFTRTLHSEMKRRGIVAKIVRIRAFRPRTYKSSKLNAARRACGMKRYLYLQSRKENHG